jgi:hypothetical protein
LTTFIPPGDGYTLEGYIAEAPKEPSGERLHESLTFKYRPATRIDCARLNAEMEIIRAENKSDPECAVRAEQAGCEFVAKRVIVWDLKSAGTHAVPVSAAACERMHPFLYGSLFNIIRGIQASDKKPEAKEPPKTDEDMQKN